jgi:preprotein translocase subunit SecG
MSNSSKQWRAIIGFADIVTVVLVIIFLALIGQHYLRFKELIFPLEGVLFLVPLFVLRVIATKEKKKCEAREASKDLRA